MSNNEKKFKLYPASVETEHSMLAALLLDNAVAAEYMPRLSIEDFSDKKHRTVYMAMEELFGINKPIDLISVSDKMRKNGTLTEVGDLPYLVEMSESIASAAGCSYYMEILKRDALLRRLLDVSKSIAEEVYTSDDADKCLASAQEKILNVTEGREKTALIHVGELVDDVMQRIERQHTDPDSSKGLLTGFNRFDYFTNGFQRSDLIILAARPGVGKTAFALNIATNIAEKEENKNILVFSLEMASNQLVQRMLCTITGVENSDINKGKIEMNDFVSLNNARQKLWKSKIYIDQTTLQSPSDILGKCRRFMIEKKCGIDLIIIDYLQLMTYPGKENKQQEVAEISRRMKLIAKEINAPLVLLSQMSRGAELRNEKPQLHDLRDSGAIEQDADMVMFLYKEKNQDPMDTIVELIIAKYRNGQQGSLAFEWHGSTFKFKSTDTDRLNNIVKVNVVDASGENVARQVAKAEANAKNNANGGNG